MNTWRDWFRQIGNDKSLTGEALKVLFVMLSYVEDGVVVPLTPSVIACIQEKKPTSVHRAIRALIEKGVIAKRHEKGKLIGYEIISSLEGTK